MPLPTTFLTANGAYAVSESVSKRALTNTAPTWHRSGATTATATQPIMP